MKLFLQISLFILFAYQPLLSQRDWRIHRRGLLHQAVYNTGELGRAYDAGRTVQSGSPSMEWPPYSSMVLNRINYHGQHCSFGSGVWIAGTKPNGRVYAFCGVVSDADGNPVPVIGVYSTPIALEKIENFSVLANGDLNPAYDPDEAEEIIISSWDTPVGVRVKRTSRAWSYPGYDSFIIYEYEFKNVTNDTIKDLFITFANTFGPSMFGYQRVHGTWAESYVAGRPPEGLGNQFARFDLRRWMSYNHERDGLPDPDHFDDWATPGNRGGLDSPQAVGIMVLHYDYEHLSTRDQTEQVFYVPSDSAGMWDENDKAKQPFLLRYENGNLPADTKTSFWMDPSRSRRTGIWQGATDSTRFADQFDPNLWDYWKGRTRGSTNLSWWQPVSRAYGFYPYILPPGETIRFSVAELAGYGPGVAGDSIYTDLGGTIRTGVDAGFWFSPIPSWYQPLHYDYLGTKDYIGRDYLQTHPLPWYVTPGVVSIRDVADRAIEMYSGDPLVKYDLLQYKPKEADPTGKYNTIPIPFPAPIIRIEDTTFANKIIWGNQVENFNTPRLHAPLHHYQLLRAQHPLGPWTVIDSVFPGDPEYFSDGEYTVFDTESNLGEYVAYSVVSVDQLGGRSGIISNPLKSIIGKAPAISTSVLQNPAASKYANITVVSDKYLQSSPKVLVLIGTDTSNIAMALIGGTQNIYEGSFEFTQSGTYSILTRAFGFNGLDTATIRSFAVLMAKPGGSESLSTLDGNAKLNIPQNSIREQTYFLAHVRESEGKTIYQFGPIKSFKRLLELEINYNPLDYPDPSRLFIYHKVGHEWKKVPSQVYTQTEKVTAFVNTLGEFTIGYDSEFSGSNLIPSDYALKQNYPNPFNPTTTIEYDLPQDGYVVLTIYNGLGQKVKTLFKGSKPAGFHQVFWDAVDERGGQVASGIYFYNLKADEFTQTKKMLLLR